MLVCDLSLLRTQPPPVLVLSCKKTIWQTKYHFVELAHTFVSVTTFNDNVQNILQHIRSKYNGIPA